MSDLPHSRSRRRRRWWNRIDRVDVVIALTVASNLIAVLQPDYVRYHAFLTIGVIGAAGRTLRPRGLAAFTAAAIGALAAVLIAAEQGRPERTIVAVTVVGVGLAVWIAHERVRSESFAQDLEQAVDAAGGIYFTGAVGDPQLEFVGDLESLLGWTEHDDGRVSLLDLLHPDDIEGYWLPDEDMRPGAVVRRIARFRTKGGGSKWLREVTRIVEHQGKLQLRGFMIDHTDHHDGLLSARTEAATDTLTGLANRRVLVKLLDRQPVAGRHLVLFDLDRFKQVNDTLGHDAGDELLCVVAKRVSARLRESDLLVRLGGDEFAIVIGPGEPAQEVVERTLAAISEPVGINSVVIHISASAGMVEETDEGAGSTDLLRRADLAMYHAKRGRLGWARFDPAMELDHERKGRLARELPAALRSGELRPFYQPIYSVDGTEILGGEALIRWVHPDFGVLGPGDFLDVVLMSAHTGTFTRTIIDHAIAMIARLDDERPCQIAVNIPVGTAEDPAFRTWLAITLENSRIRPERLVLEVSERELHSEATTGAAMSEIAALGVGLSIDDFGTGHASFDRLRWRDVQQLKLDRSLVQGAAADPRDAVVLRNVVAMAKELSYEVVGEGVETEAQREMLEHIGVDLVQGWLFAPAIDHREFLEMASSRAAA